MGKPDEAYTKLKEDTEKIEVDADWFHPFHRYQEGNFPSGARAQDFLGTSANREPLGHLHLGVEPRDLAESDAQPHLRKITIFQVTGRSDDANVTVLGFRKKCG